MTGRDLIIYILKNNLENEQVIKNGKIIGYMNIDEAALKFGVGNATVKLWCDLKLIPGDTLGNNVYIPAITNKPIIL